MGPTHRSHTIRRHRIWRQRETGDTGTKLGGTHDHSGLEYSEGPTIGALLVIARQTASMTFTRVLQEPFGELREVTRDKLDPEDPSLGSACQLHDRLGRRCCLNR